ncbi:UspA [Dillenia turbinata]|uniref:UspA n=1 Tax=Dillenia turbinata TaxID=194707 RepID=A0AAN8W2S3_9MAGN
MPHLAPAKILIGISLNIDDGKELLSWAIRVLAQPDDTIIALHVLVWKEKKKQHLRIDQKEFRKAKAYVISVLGEFAETCQKKQVNLEARVALSTSIGRALIEDAKSISVDYLLLGGSRNKSNRTSMDITRYCFENAPEKCSVVSTGKSMKALKDSDFSSSHFEEFCQSSSRWLSKSSRIKKVGSKSERLKASPRTVLNEFEGDTHTMEEDNSSFEGSSITESPPLVPKDQTNNRKQVSPIKLISSFLRSPFNLYERKKIKSDSNHYEKEQPLLRCFSYEEISNATNNFHLDNLVGRGGFAEVYRGDLDDGRVIAVKRLAKDNTDENKEKEFLMELGIIGHVCHPNTANLVGCCIENGLHLIFNFSPNGNLASALHGKASKALKWSVRYKIVVGVARGLHYLHKCCKHRIIHRDIKASNVLLGPDYEPQITDFGLAKWLPNKWTHHAVIPIEGTFGYLAPEYFMHGIVDEKTDVFAFGVLLLEIITGRAPVDSSKINLLQWAKPIVDSGDFDELADPRLGGEYHPGQFQRLVLTASYCIRQSSIWRPSMTEVLELLLNDRDPEIAQSWRFTKYTADDLIDDCSMDFDYELPSDISWDGEELLRY